MSEAVKKAMREFNSLKVQILIDNDDVPENAVNVLELERLEKVLEEAPVPSRVYVDVIIKPKEAV